MNLFPGLIYRIARSAGIDVSDEKSKTEIRCPILGHEDNRASAVLFRDSNVFFCFVCTSQKGIGAKEFAQRLGVSWDGAFSEALSSLPPKVDMRSPPTFTISDIERLWPVFLARADADEFDPSDEPVRSYLASRGLEDVLARGLAGIVGMADDLPRSISKWPLKGYRAAAALYSLQGVLRSLQARAVCEADPKVMLPAKAPAKGLVFANEAGLARLRQPAPAASGPVILCEGITDFWSTALATELPVLGVPGTVFARSAFGDWTKRANVVLAMDNDHAGKEATSYAAREARKQGARSVRAIQHPEGLKDLCDIVARHGVGGLRSFLAAHVEGVEGASSTIGGGVIECPVEKPAARVRVVSPVAEPDSEGAVESEAEEGAPTSIGFPATTDTGNAERFCRLAGGDFRYCPPWQKWLVWTGTRWEEDKLERAMALSKLVPVAIRDDAESATTKEAIKKLEAWAETSESQGRRKALVALAQCEPGIPVSPSQFDRDSMLLNCRNGTIDLRDGSMRPHRREDLITKVTPCDYDPLAEAPVWTRFLEQVLPDPEVRAFVQRLVGYSLTGSQAEQVIAFLIGEGANGKSTFLTAIQNAVGSDYSIQVSSEILLKRFQRGHPTELADLFGVRIAVCVETGQQAELDEVLVKVLTGGDPIRARRMREDFWQFEPTHHVWVASNHRPSIRGTDHAIWRRVLVVPFEVKFLRAQQDRALPAKLQAEAVGILNWAVQGCRAWAATGLEIPDAVRGQVESYRVEMDVMQQFFEDCCEFDVTARAGATRLYRVYASWSELHGELVLSQTQFGSELRRRHIASGKSSGLRVYRGLRLKANYAPIPDEGRQGHQGQFSTLSTHARASSDLDTRDNEENPPYRPYPPSIAGLERGESGLARPPEGGGDSAERSTRSISTASKPFEEVDPLGADEGEM